MSVYFTYINYLLSQFFIFLSSLSPLVVAGFEDLNLETLVNCSTNHATTAAWANEFYFENTLIIQSI